MSIGERIITLRKEKGLSQGQLASAMGISRQAVSKWENDLSSPDTLKMIQLADVLGTDVEYLASGRQNTQEPVVITEVQEKIVEVEKIVEKPVIQVVEKKIPQFIDHIIEKPVMKRVVRVRYLRNPVEFMIFGIICFLAGLLVGFLVF